MTSRPLNAYLSPSPNKVRHAHHRPRPEQVTGGELRTEPPPRQRPTSVRCLRERNRGSCSDFLLQPKFFVLFAKPLGHLFRRLTCAIPDRAVPAASSCCRFQAGRWAGITPRSAAISETERPPRVSSALKCASGRPFELWAISPSLSHERPPMPSSLVSVSPGLPHARFAMIDSPCPQSRLDAPLARAAPGIEVDRGAAGARPPGAAARRANPTPTEPLPRRKRRPRRHWGPFRPAPTERDPA